MNGTRTIKKLIESAAGAVGICVLAICAGGLWGCDYFSDMVTPQEYSTSSFTAILIDTAGATPRAVAEASLSLAGTAASSDDNGVARFAGVRTGIQTLEVNARSYWPVRRFVEVTLTSVVDTFYLRRRPGPPIIDSFIARPNQTLARDDTVWFSLGVRDSLWPLRRVLVEYGDSQLSISPLLSGGPVTNRIPHVYRNAGEYSPRLIAVCSNGDTSSVQIPVSVSTNVRPWLTVSFRQVVFYHNVPNLIRVNAGDSDGNFQSVRIVWGDGTPPEVYGSQVGIYPHTYLLHDSVASAVYALSITAFDDNGATTVYGRSVFVSRIPPLVLGRLNYTPPIVTATDSTVSIGVEVLGTPGYVSLVSWSLNQSGIWRHVELFDSLSGTAPAQFAHSFGTSSLPDTNYVLVEVRDSYGQTDTLRDVLVFER